MIPFKIEYHKSRKLQISRFISIGLVETVGTEFLKLKERFWRARKNAPPLVAFFLKRKETVSPFGSGDARPTIILSKLV